MCNFHSQKNEERHETNNNKKNYSKTSHRCKTN